MNRAWVYILTNKPHGVLYTGICNANIVRRIWEHNEGGVRGFTHKYNLKTLVFFEPHQDVTYAAERERRTKRWRREWKIALIEKTNPDWRDLYPDLLG